MIWTINYSVRDIDESKRLRDLRSDSSNIYFDFAARDLRAAKKRVLEFIQARVRRLRRKTSFSFWIFAAPTIPGTNTYDGDQLIRVKYRYMNRRILRIKNPDAAFYYGTGAKALEQRYS